LRQGWLTSESRAMMGYESSMAIVSTTRDALSIECVRKALVAYAAYVEVEYLLKTSTRVKRYSLLSNQSLDSGVITIVEAHPAKAAMTHFLPARFSMSD
jgi:hypothetical protein